MGVSPLSGRGNAATGRRSPLRHSLSAMAYSSTDLMAVCMVCAASAVRRRNNTFASRGLLHLIAMSSNGYAGHVIMTARRIPTPKLKAGIPSSPRAIQTPWLSVFIRAGRPAVHHDVHSYSFVFVHFITGPVTQGCSLPSQGQGDEAGMWRIRRRQKSMLRPYGADRE